MYKNTDVSINAPSLVANRMKKLFDQVTMKLPDEEQFEIKGEIFMGSRKAVENFCIENSLNHKFGLDPNTTLSIKEANRTFDLHEDFEDSEYLITLIVG